MRKFSIILTGVIAISAVLSGLSFAVDQAVLQKWIEEFQPCAMSKEDQMKELEWFAKAAEPYKGKKIRSVAEGIKTHQWEADVLTKAFEEITELRSSTTSLGKGRS